ncbi:MAG: hypothetical protein EZS28_041457, partial [Streblomastix strix]
IQQIKKLWIGIKEKLEEDGIEDEDDALLFHTDTRSHDDHNLPNNFYRLYTPLVNATTRIHATNDKHASPKNCYCIIPVFLNLSVSSSIRIIEIIIDYITNEIVYSLVQGIFKKHAYSPVSFLSLFPSAPTILKEGSVSATIVKIIALNSELLNGSVVQPTKMSHSHLCGESSRPKVFGMKNAMKLSVAKSCETKQVDAVLKNFVMGVATAEKKLLIYQKPTLHNFRFINLQHIVDPFTKS